MAAPPSVVISNLSGKWSVNKAQSDDIEQIFVIQGATWVVRKAINLGTPRLHIKHYTSPSPDSDLPSHITHPGVEDKFPGNGKDGLEHLDTSNNLSGISGSTEMRILNGQPRDNEDHVYGGYTGTTEWSKIENLELEWTKEGWLDEMKEGKGVIWDKVKGRGKEWDVQLVWGFAKIDGQRRMVKKVVAKNPEKTANVRIVYDYDGPE